MLLWRAISVGVCMDLRIFFQLKAQMRDVIFQAKQVIVKCNASDLLHVFIAFFLVHIYRFSIFIWHFLIFREIHTILNEINAISRRSHLTFKTQK